MVKIKPEAAALREFSKRLQAAFANSPDPKLKGKSPVTWMAEWCGTSPQAAQKWWNGESLPVLARCIVIAQMLKTDFGQLMNVTVDSYPNDENWAKIVAAWPRLSFEYQAELARRMIFDAEVAQNRLTSNLPSSTPPPRVEKKPYDPLTLGSIDDAPPPRNRRS